jgi:hypothetical protein
VRYVIYIYDVSRLRVNIQQLYALPTLYLCIFIYLKDSDFCPIHHKLIDFYNREEKCLLRGTNWVFKQSNLSFVFKGKGKDSIAGIERRGIKLLSLKDLLCKRRGT